MRTKKQRTPSELGQLPDDALINEPEALSIIYCSRTHFWRGVKSGRYPQPIKLGPRMNRYNIGAIRKVAKGEAA